MSAEKVVDIGGQRKKSRRDVKRKDFGSVEFLFEHWTLLYGTTTIWDNIARKIIPVAAAREAYPDAFKSWRESPLKKMIPAENLVFSPKKDPGPGFVNLFNGLPLAPEKGDCLPILQLLNHLVGERDELFDWVLRWIAFQVQNPGAKMRTAVLMHGDEGSGKNLFWEIVAKLFGEYGTIINQDRLEDQHNGWASRKLFVIADEVVTRNELRHNKGRLKNYITGSTAQINEKFLPCREESNHMNFVFFSNELTPLALDESDRRYLVVWTPPPQDKAYYKAIADNADSGGLDAFAWHLLNEVDISDFSEHAKPPVTEEKERLIGLCATSAQSFLRDWQNGRLPVPFGVCATGDLYKAYCRWCGDNGEKPSSHKWLSAEAGRRWKINTLYVGETRESREKPRLILPVPITPEEGQSQQQWLNTQLLKFRFAVESWGDE